MVVDVGSGFFVFGGCSSFFCSWFLYHLVDVVVLVVKF